MTPRTTLALLVGLLATTMAFSAVGGTEEEARTHFQQGVELYEQGDYEAAAIAFNRAYELKHYALALGAFTRYLAEGGDAVPPERLTKVKGEIKRLNALVGMIYLDCPLTDARVQVDNETRGTTPLDGPIFVDIGKHEVIVKHGAKELLREVVRVAGGQRVELEVIVDDGGAVAGGGDGGSGEPEPEPEDGPERVWTWVALGVGGAAAIAGGAIGGAALAKRKDLEAENCDGQSCYQSSKSEGDSIEKMNLTADVLFGVAAAGIVTGIVLFFVEPDEDGEEQVAVAPGITGDGAGLFVGGTF